MKTKQVALVTGGTRGIGLGIAHCLANEGFDLAICGRRETSAVEEPLQGLRDRGAEVHYRRADVGQAEARAALVAAVAKHYGRLNVLVNNAGVAASRCDILNASESEFERVLGTNLQGPHFLTQRVANWMIEQRQTDSDLPACIINVSSISATIASVSRGEYCISKAGMGMSTQLWATRLAEFGIPVFEIRPGIIATDMTAEVKDKYDDLIEKGLIPQNRWGQPEDVGRVAAALARGDFDYATGQILMVDGGLSLARL